MPRVGRVAAVVALCATLTAASAVADPGSGPRGHIDQSFTTTAPGAPTGLKWSGRYHAEGDPEGDPPFMRKMVFFPPRGMRYDTSVPERCEASDFELQMQGPDACPEGSRLGTGTTEGVFFIPFTQGVVLDRFKHNLYVVNAADQQIVLVEAEGYAVVRGRFRDDGALEFESPTCFPEPPTGECLDDHVLQTASATFVPAYTKKTRRRVRSYATTPPKCPASGHWTTRVRFWWATGEVDTVPTTQPCTSRRG